MRVCTHRTPRQNVEASEATLQRKHRLNSASEFRVHLSSWWRWSRSSGLVGESTHPQTWNNPALGFNQHSCMPPTTYPTDSAGPKPPFVITSLASVDVDKVLAIILLSAAHVNNAGSSTPSSLLAH